MISVGSFMIEDVNILHVASVVRREISVWIAAKVCMFVFIVTNMAKSKLIVPFSFSVKCRTLHP